MRAKINADRTAAVDQEYFWQAIDGSTPVGVKVQLLTRFGCAIYGILTPNNKSDFAAWAPCPKKPEWLKV